MINLTFDEITQEAELADKNPTEFQKEKGNYRMGHVTIKGFKISIENAKGSFRRYKDENGNEKSNEMKCHYGYFRNSKGHDGDHVDVFIGEYLDFDSVFVIDQKYPDGGFDESKVMLGFRNKEEAKAAYLSNYDETWDGFMGITEVSIDIFKKWLYRKRKQRKPFGEYVKIIAHKLNEMKNILKEEEYNQIISLGTFDNPDIALAIQHKLYNMGIDTELKDNELLLSVEQDRNDPHYVDDVLNIAKNEIKKCLSQTKYNERQNLACSKTRLTNNELNFILSECIKILTEGEVFNDAMFAIVKAQAKRMARKKIISALTSSDFECKTNFDKCISKICSLKKFMSQNDCIRMAFNAIDEIMENECKTNGLTEHDMYKIVVRGLMNKFGI